MQVRRPQLSIWEKMYFPQIFKGLWLTLKHIPKRKFTRQYPEEKPPLYGDYRGAPVLVRDPQGRVKCVACQLCEFVCPPKAIRVIPGYRPEERFDANVEKEPKDFIIDMLRCIYCGYCEEVCPEEAIFLQRDFSITGYKREELQFHKDKLLELGGVRADSIWKWKYAGAPPPDAPAAPERKPEGVVQL
ncbi:MAG TPA: NADH-quinone oxidoreductase subunit I [Verrucomicrobiae bacterium]|nr:NADH-quinone oxidoreductase subunit I [Verrucomicrobiae bacterium]